MPRRPCLGCGAPTAGSRCPSCPAPTSASPIRVQRVRGRTPAERRRRADAVSAWRAEYGDNCPGWGIPAHSSADLTADHITPVAAGGMEDGPLTVLCRSCNGRKADRG